jgi:hypothetical protein
MNTPHSFKSTNPETRLRSESPWMTARRSTRDTPQFAAVNVGRIFDVAFRTKHVLYFTDIGIRCEAGRQLDGAAEGQVPESTHLRAK